MRQQWRRWRLLLLLVVATAVAACKADVPPLSDGDGNVDGECTPYADLLVAYTPAAGGTSDAGSLALGAPDDQTVTVAANDVLTVGFVGLGAIQDSEEIGDDIRVDGTAADGTEIDVNLSDDGEAWENAGTLAGDDLAIDIADTASLSLVVYVQLVGVSGQLSVDAVESLQTVCTTSVR